MTGIRPEPVEGIVEHGILELPSGTPNFVVGLSVIDFGPRPVGRVVDQCVAGILRATGDCTLDQGVLGTQPEILECALDHGGVIDTLPETHEHAVDQCLMESLPELPHCIVDQDVIDQDVVHQDVVDVPLGPLHREIPHMGCSSERRYQRSEAGFHGHFVPSCHA